MNTHITNIDYISHVKRTGNPWSLLCNKVRARESVIFDGNEGWVNNGNT